MFDTNGIKIEPKLHVNLGSTKRSERVGILNRGRDTKIINCEFSGQNIAIQNEGENLLAQNNKIK